MKIFDFLSLSPDTAKEHLVYGTVTPGTTSFEFYINRTTSSSGGTTITVTPDDQGNWYWDNKEEYAITNLAGMFYHRTTLTSVVFGSGFDTSGVTNMGGMFDSCEALTSIDVSNLDTSSVTGTGMTNVFNSCRTLTNIVGLSNWDTSGVTDMKQMFSACEALTNIVGLSNWDTSSVTDMRMMFLGCFALTSIDVSNWDTSSVTTMANMFKSCNALTSIDMSNWTTSQITTSSSYNYFVPNILTLTIDYDSTKWNPAIPAAFPKVNWNVGHLVYGKVTPGTTSFQFYINRTTPSSGGTTITVTPDAQGNWYWDNEEEYAITNLVGMFYQRSMLTSVAFGSEFNTSSVTNMYAMFYRCNALTNIVGLSNFDTSSVTDMRQVFDNCTALTSIDMSNWDTSIVTRMNGMFNECTALTSIAGLSNWDTSGVTDINSMFKGCTALTSIDMSNWTTSQITTSSKYGSFVPNISTLTIDYNSTKWNSAIPTTFPNVNWHNISVA